MKKIVFAFQVFGLMVMFPLYVVVELNHGTKSMPVNNSDSFATEKQIKKNMRSVINPKIENENKFPVISLIKSY